MGFDQWKLTNSSIPFHEHYIRVRKDHLKSPQGEETDYVYLEDSVPGTVVVVAVTPDNRIPLVKQYRYPIQKHQYNLPGGCIDEGETPEQAAARELKEETGISASEWISLGTFHPMSSHHTREAHLFVAKGLSFGHQDLDPYEDLQVEYHAIEELMQRITTNAFTDMELCCAILLAKAKNLI